ncbi:conserved unknown protein [Ectocarpus siliculosus]|uniref:CAP-Gly domain-containing protein n=1 Tax=Ectocarpus siliculosus TaxID=2880 RepID=D8LH61_ECTSI|nr:conserved unknown protein [Ectocarpus siliculosus]|eukprot:CBN74280.1 conserved unknown protein [Ectocarpus siliculosus]
MATFASRVALGSRVTVTGKKGVVKFIGPTDFAAGEWIGVELDLQEGKNDGLVNGVQYFDCREGHGLFVKKAQVRLDRSATAATAASAKPGAMSPSSPTMPTTGTGRAASRLQAIREKNKALKETLAAGKTSPQAQRPTFSSPRGSRSPGGFSVKDGLDVPGSPASLVSIGSIGSEARRGAQTISSSGHDVQAPSPTTPSLGSSRAIRATGIKSFRRQTDVERATPGLEEKQGSTESLASSPMPPPPSRAIEQASANVEMDALRLKAAQATSEAEEAQARLAEATEKLDAREASCRELEGKLSLFQRKSENALGEERLKASTLAKEKAAAAAAGRREADMEVQVSELTDTCEALTLDKEQLSLEKEDLQEKLDELQMELDSTKLDLEHAQLNAKENEAAARALSAAGGARDGSVDVKMLAEQNVQLKEALKRLHTHSIAEKTDLTKAIRSLEKEATSTAGLKDEVEKLRSWKDSKAAEMEDLLEKLDESKAYEEMVEALTTKNLEIGERCGELEATIADLESSVEMSEELETQQAEDIRELQSELTGREVSLHNQKLALESVMKELQDTKQTIDRFREYADRLKASRDELAAASKSEIGTAALATAEKRALLTQKASIEKMATQARRAKMSGKLLQVNLLDAQARSSRISMLLPGSLGAAETELRCIDADLSVCRLARKAGIALELLELPAIEFVDVFAAVPGAAQHDEEGGALEDTTLDRATAMEDCSRLALEAEQSSPIARAIGEALAVLSATVSVPSSKASPAEVAAVSSEVASAVGEAEELVDGLLRVIQDEGGLRPAGSATTVSALAATTTSIGIRRAAAVPSGGYRASADDNTHKSDGERGGSVCAAVAALQDCLVSARRAVLAVTSAALRGADAPRVSRVLVSQREDGVSMLWKSVRGLWGDLMALRSVAYNGCGNMSAELEQVALGAKEVLEKVSTHAVDHRKGAPDPTASELAKQVTSLRPAAKDLLRSPTTDAGVQDGTHMPPFPRATWRAVAPWLAQDTSRSSGEADDVASSMPAPCVSRAEGIRMMLEEAIELKPELEAARAQTADMTVELAAKSKELIVATSKREQLEVLLEKTEGSQITSADLQKQVLVLQETSRKFEQENKFIAEALEDLQDSTSRLEAENRSLKVGASTTGRASLSGGSSGKLSQPIGTRSTPSISRVPGREGPTTDVPVKGASVMAVLPGSAVASPDTEESLTSVLKWSQAEVSRLGVIKIWLHSSRWRGRVFTSVLAGLKPLPHLSPAQGGCPQSSPAHDGTMTDQKSALSSRAEGSIRELLNLSKKLAAVREPPRVVGVKGAARVEVPSGGGGVAHVARDGIPKADNGEGTSSSASVTWQEQQALNARLEKEWREGQGRAAKAVTSLLGFGPGGSSAFAGEAKLATNQGAAAGVRVARLRLPSGTRFASNKAKQAVVPVTLGRVRLARVQQALTV